MGAIAVLSRADELGAGRLNAMAVVGKAVDKLREDPTLEGRLRDGRPGGRAPRACRRNASSVGVHDPRRAGRAAARELHRFLVSADRFISAEATRPSHPAGACPPDGPVRSVRPPAGRRDDSRWGARRPDAGQELAQHSGLADLRRVIDVHFRRRHPQLKAHALMLALQELVRSTRSPVRRMSSLPRTNTLPTLARSTR